MDTVGASVYGQIPALESLPPVNDDGGSAMHVYTPWWLYKEQQAGKLPFARGYHIEPSGGRRDARRRRHRRDPALHQGQLRQAS